MSYGPDIWIRGPVESYGPEGPGALFDEAPEASAPSDEFSWVSVHGGAGASSLAALVGGVDVGNRWPDPAQGEPPVLLLVSRTHAAGLSAVSRTLDAFRRGDQPEGLEVAAVVLVADAPGRTPRELNKRIKILRSVVAVHRIPWVPAWRTGELKGSVPREVSDLARIVGTLTQ